jgi:glucose-6-phosphate isomerase, archaeal
LKLDLTKRAGFPLYFDPDRLDISTGTGPIFKREARCRWQMDKVLRQPTALPDEREIYWTYSLQARDSNCQLFERLAMTFGLVLLPPLRIGAEFVKTHGHYHSSMPDAAIGYAEVYTHYFGTLYLYMQRRIEGDPARLDNCTIYEMIPGCSILIPPGFAHILINPSEKPALMAGLYSVKAEHVYEPIQSMGGGAYHLLQEAGQERFVPNMRYSLYPELERLAATRGTRFASPNSTAPLWTTFIEDPMQFSFIYDSAAACRYFLPEDQRL